MITDTNTKSSERPPLSHSNSRVWRQKYMIEAALWHRHQLEMLKLHNCVGSSLESCHLLGDTASFLWEEAGRRFSEVVDCDKTGSCCSWSQCGCCNSSFFFFLVPELGIISSLKAGQRSAGEGCPLFLLWLNTAKHSLASFGWTWFWMCG